MSPFNQKHSRGFSACALFVFVLGISSIYTSEARADTALHAAQACYLEAEWRIADCVAILWVLQKRAAAAQRTFEEQLWGYTALKSATPRSRLAKGLPAGDYEHWSKTQNASWRAVREAAAAVLGGSLKSPCPGAVHWGAPDLDNDVQRAFAAITRGDWKIVRCRERTANIFYALTSNGDPDRVAARLALLQDRLSVQLWDRMTRASRARVDARVASGSYPDRTRSLR